MAKAKLKSKPAAKPDDAGKIGGKSIMESAQQIWLAGLGAFAKAQDEGGKLFETLMREGSNLEQKTRKIASGKVDEVRGAHAGNLGQARTGLREPRLPRAGQARGSRPQGARRTDPPRRRTQSPGPAPRLRQAGDPARAQLHQQHPARQGRPRRSGQGYRGRTTGGASGDEGRRSGAKTRGSKEDSGCEKETLARAGDAVPGVAQLYLAYQCTPRSNEAKATCSLVACVSSSPLPFMPLAAVESGNRRNAVFIRIS